MILGQIGRGRDVDSSSVAWMLAPKAGPAPLALGPAPPKKKIKKEKKTGKTVGTRTPHRGAPGGPLGTAGMVGRSIHRPLAVDPSACRQGRGVPQDRAVHEDILTTTSSRTGSSTFRPGWMPRNHGFLRRSWPLRDEEREML